MVAGAFALTRIESGILGPLQGWLVDRFGPRAILTIGTVLFGVGFILFGQVESLLTFYLTFALIALGASLGGFATLMVAIVNWFSRHRSKAIAVSQLGFSLGGLSVPLIIWALEAFGWRATAVVSGPWCSSSAFLWYRWCAIDRRLRGSWQTGTRPPAAVRRDASPWAATSRPDKPCGRARSG